MKSMNPFSGTLPPERIKTDYLHRLAWGTDASFYRKIPRLVLFPDTEEEVSEILDMCNKKQIAVTFRAAGTSLSGQSLSDSVLLVASTRWDKYQVHDGGKPYRCNPASLETGSMRSSSLMAGNSHPIRLRFLLPWWVASWPTTPRA